MPIIEAMASGTPVVTSNSTSLPEIADGAAMLVDPNSPEDIALGIRTVLENPQVRQQLRQWGLERAREFSWDRSAELVAQRYRALLAIKGTPQRTGLNDAFSA